MKRPCCLLTAAVGAVVLTGCGGPSQQPEPEVNYPPSARTSAPINEHWPSTTPGGEAVSPGAAIPSDSAVATKPAETNKKTGQ